MATRIAYHDGDRAGRIGPAHPTDPQKYRGGDSYSTHSSGAALPGSVPDIQKKMQGFFGLPNTRNQGSGYYEHELHTFPENYTEAFQQAGWGGKDTSETFNNSHLAQVMLEKTSYSRCFPLVMSPWAAHPSSMTSSFHTVNFTQHVMDRLPELSIPRLLSRTETSGSVSLGRYGIAMMLEQTFFETEKGRRTYALQLEQMKIAVVTTACMDILVTLLTHEPWEAKNRDGVVDEESSTSAAGIDRILSEEKAMTAIMNKGHGADLLLSKMKGKLLRRGVGSGGNFTVLPEGSERCFKSGSAYQSNLVLEETDDTVDRAMSGARHTIIKSSPFSMGHGSPSYDPMFRLRAYGIFNRLTAMDLGSIKPEQYKTACLDKTIFDRGMGYLRRAEYGMYYNRGGHYRFHDRNAPLCSRTSEIGRQWALDLGVYTWGQAMKKHMLPNMRRIFNQLIHDRCKDNPRLQQEFINSLRVLKKDAPQLRCANGAYPTEDDYDPKTFLAMCSPDAPFDTVPTVADYRDALNNGGRTKPTARGNTVKRTLQQMQREDSELTAQELFEMNANEEQVQMTNRDEYVRDGDVVTRKTGGNVTVRNVRHEYRMQRNNPNDSQVALRKQVQDQTDLTKVDADMRDYSGVWLKAIADAPGYPDEMKMARINSLRTCIAGARAFLDHNANPGVPKQQRDPTYKKWVLAIVDHLMSRVTSSYDVQAALNELSGDITEQTLLEQSAVAVGRIPTRPTIEERGDLKWNASGNNEEGQLHLMGRFPLRQNQQALPADAFAATLSSRGRVALLQSENMGNTLSVKLGRSFGASPRMGRKIALAWSIIISHFFHGSRLLNNENAFNKTVDEVKTMIAAELSTLDVETKERLLAYASSVDGEWTVPLSQAPFAPAVKALCAAVTEQLKNQGAPVAAPPAGGRVAAAAAAAAPSPLFISSVQTVVNSLTQLLPDEALFYQTIGHVKPADIDRAMKLNKSPKELLESASQIVSASTFQWNDQNVHDLLDRASFAYGNFWKFCVENDLPVVFDLILARPVGIYEMGSALHMQAGGQNPAAETRWMMPHFATGADPGAKVFFGHYTAYMSPVVLRNDAIVVAPDVYVRSYRRGHGMTVNDPNEETHKAAWVQGKGASIFVLAIPQVDCNKRSHSWMSITGRLPSSLPADKDVQESLLYPGCQAFAKFWGFSGSSIDNYSNKRAHIYKTSAREVSQNTICFQDFEVGWSPSTEAWTNYTLHEGHFGKYSCYPGAEDVLNGRAPHFEDKPAYYSASAGVAG